MRRAVLKELYNRYVYSNLKNSKQFNNNDNNQDHHHVDNTTKPLITSQQYRDLTEVYTIDGLDLFIILQKMVRFKQNKQQQQQHAVNNIEYNNNNNNNTSDNKDDATYTEEYILTASQQAEIISLDDYISIDQSLVRSE
eukprot:UN09653